MRNQLVFLGSLAIFAGLSIGTNSFASGYEKSIMFGGETSGVAGIATPYIQGSQALYFNPAGLVGDKTGQDVSLNVSAAMPTFKGPIDLNGDSETSKSVTLFPFSLMYGNTLTDNLGVGVGIYTSAGSSVDYNNLSYSGYNGTMEAKNQLTVIEYSLGVGYKVDSKLKVGLSWRIVQASASLAVPQPVSQSGIVAIAQTSMDGLKDTEYNGFKLGAQYKLDDKTELGLTFRSEVDFKAKGTQTVVEHLPATAGGTVSSLGTSDVTVGTTLPAALTIGAVHQYGDTWKSMFEYAWTQYSKVDNLAIQTSTSSTPLLLKWKDQHNIRLAGEYSGFSWPIRFGYILTTAVTNGNYALATFTPPGTANTLTIGTGQSFGAFRVDGGIEYTMGSGSGTTSSTNPLYQGGTYSVNEYALHLGGSYTF